MSILRVELTAGALDSLRSLAASGYPDEACGALVGGVSAGVVSCVEVTSARNMVVERSRDRYDLDPTDLLRADRWARERGIDVVGIWHSHPDHPAWPSTFDSERAWVDYAYVICSTSAHGAGDVNAFALPAEDGVLEQVELAVGEQAAAP